MPLVDFNPTKLNEGYNYDVNRFNNEQKSNIIMHSSFNTIDSFDSVNKNIQSILDELKNAVKAATKKDWIYFEYSHDVPELIKTDNINANKLWGLRHALCYQLLIYTYYKSVNETYTVDDLNLFKLGIFGSVTPTSDIDIGFQYAKAERRLVGIIAHVVKTFEDAFIDLTQKYSLGYDIEPYADMMYLDDNEGGLFYCDSTDFDESDLLKIMPAIGASIIRNVVQSKIDSDSKKYIDMRRYKSQEKQTGGTIENIQKLIDDFNFSDIHSYFVVSLHPKITDEIQITEEINTTFSTIFANTSWTSDAKKLATEYMTTYYNNSRNNYYEKVKYAETILSEITLTRDTTIDKEKRLNLMVAIAEALVFRAESYVSPSTVMHVVRVIQAEEKCPPEGCEALKIKKSKAQCVLGKFGYVMSCMEQIGYLYRFNETYCKEGSHKNENKCNAKYKKYFPRLVDGIKRLNNPMNKTTGGGNRRRRYSKKIYKKMKTHRLKKLHKIRQTRHKRQ
jgi:hypothetical protein